MKPKRITILLAITISFMAVPQMSRAGEWVSGTASTDSGTRNYNLWVPSGLVKQEHVPLVMMLHTCTQKPEDLATGSGMNEIADRNNFLVVYPDPKKPQMNTDRQGIDQGASVECLQKPKPKPGCGLCLICFYPLPPVA